MTQSSLPKVSEMYMPVIAGSFPHNSSDIHGKTMTKAKKSNLPHHKYTALEIFYWLSLVLFASIGLRGCSRVIFVTMQVFGYRGVTPSWYAGRLWLMRLGYYKLTRAKQKADDWIWIIDHSVQTGQEKTLVILGLPLSKLPMNRALTYEDVEPIELLPVTQSNGEIVYGQLKEAIKKTGVPREIIADKGSDIKAGIERFCNEHQETCYIYDVKHALATLLKKELLGDKLWEDFTKKCSETKQLLQQTSLAALAPPNQRSKARYMNLDILVKWGVDVCLFLNKSDAEISSQFDLSKVTEKLSWVKNYERTIQEWSNIMTIVSFTEDFIRKNGFYVNADLALKNKLLSFSTGNREQTVVNNVVSFIKNESDKARPQERLLGSSEIIESLFGKQKDIEKQQVKSGFTGLLLALAALVSETTQEIVHKAMSNTKTKNVLEWYKNNIGKSVQSKRRRAFDSNASVFVAAVDSNNDLVNPATINLPNTKFFSSSEIVLEANLVNIKEQKCSQFYQQKLGLIM